ncbi:MAG: substrate-binding domain-containing protein [Burkholderiaceae bacterium]
MARSASDSETFSRRLLRDAPPSSRDAFNVGLLLPMSGVQALLSPSAYACARLACETWNEEGGVDGREVRLTLLDSAAVGGRLDDDLGRLLQPDIRGRRQVDALVNLSTTAHCQRIAEIVSARVPLIYTPYFEGRGLPPWVHAIGETTDRQLLPAIDWVADRHRVRRWFLLGHDYCWPRQSHHRAIAHLKARGDEVADVAYVPMGHRRFEPILERIERSRADALLISLVGADSIYLCRAFGDSRLAGKVVRLSVAIEENALLGMGHDNTDGLYVAHGYFGSVDSDANGLFRERYHQRFGARAPTLNGPAQSAYEGFVHLHRLVAQAGVTRRAAPSRLRSVRAGYRARAARDGDLASNAGRDPIYLARAEGLGLRVIQPIAGA